MFCISMRLTWVEIPKFPSVQLRHIFSVYNRYINLNPGHHIGSIKAIILISLLSFANLFIFISGCSLQKKRWMMVPRYEFYFRDFEWMLNTISVDVKPCYQDQMTTNRIFVANTCFVTNIYLHRSCREV